MTIECLVKHAGKSPGTYWIYLFRDGICCEIYRKLKDDLVPPVCVQYDSTLLSTLVLLGYYVDVSLLCLSTAIIVYLASWHTRDLTLMPPSMHLIYFNMQLSRNRVNRRVWTADHCCVSSSLADERVSGAWTLPCRVVHVFAYFTNMVSKWAWNNRSISEYMKSAVFFYHLELLLKTSACDSVACVLPKFSKFTILLLSQSIICSYTACVRANCWLIEMLSSQHLWAHSDVPTLCVLISWININLL